MESVVIDASSTDALADDCAVFKVGDLCTEYFYTDAHAGRIIEVRRNGREVVFQEDFAKSDFKPQVVPGGFVGHCANNSEQKYTHSPNPDGKTSVHTIRTWRGKKVWTRKGDTPRGRNSIGPGQHHFHDYNF